MPRNKSIGAPSLSLAAIGTLAVGLVSVGPTFMATASASASTPASSALIANDTLIVTGTNGSDVVSLRADATTAQVAFGDDPANVYRFELADFNAIAVSLGNGD